MKLVTYIIRRLLLLIPVLLGVAVLVFTLTRFTGDPAAAYITPKMDADDIARVRQDLGLDQDVFHQFYAWLTQALQGNLGYSKAVEMPVTEAIGHFFPATIELTLLSMFISVILGIFLGIISAVYKDTVVDHTTRVTSLVAVSIPVFWLGLLLLYAFYIIVPITPGPGRLDATFDITEINRYTGFYFIDTALNGRWDMFSNYIGHLILPSITLSFATTAYIVRMMRSSMLEVLGAEYIRTARMKGASEKTVINRHASRNALIPTTTIIGLQFGALLTGAVLTETIFDWEGLGWWSVAAVFANDTAAIIGFALITAIVYVSANLVVDILYAYLDPRVRLD